MHVNMHCRVIDQQLGIDRMAACKNVKLSKILADVTQINEPINRAQQVILWNMVLQRELIK